MRSWAGNSNDDLANVSLTQDRAHFTGKEEESQDSPGKSENPKKRYKSISLLDVVHVESCTGTMELEFHPYVSSNPHGIAIMTTGAAGSSNNDTSPKKKGWPKGRKRRLHPKDSNAPKGPLSGYMLFMSDQREILRQTNSGLAFHEITKLVAQKWAQLDTSAKTKYLEAAEADKERYHKELEEYQKTDAYKSFMQKQNQQDQEDSPTPPKKPRKEVIEERKEEEEEESIPTQSSLEIPIFTEEFLNHNKIREAELRQLRKSNTDYEEQNAILQKHIESMKSTVEKLESETSQQRSNNAALQQHIETLRKTLVKAFSGLPLPDTQETPSEDSIDSYMVQLHSVIVNNPQQHQSLIQTVRGIVSQLALT